ncbi:hypothetical protein JYT22_00305, partial [Endomicrobium sp. AH-315-J14]|nr:hypothetical protein [Endomicrobium sp. AH-315-J14]
LDITSSGGLDIVVLEIDPSKPIDKAHVEDWTYGGQGNQRSHAISLDSFGKVAIGGAANMGLGIAGDMTQLGGRDMFVAEFAGDSQDDWAQVFGGLANEEILCVAHGPGNQVAAGGFHLGTAIIESKVNVADAIDGVVVVLTPTGQIMWFHFFKGGSTQSVRGVAINGDSQVIAVLNDNGRGRVVALTDDGNQGATEMELLAIDAVEPGALESFDAIALDPEGNIFVVGSHAGAVTIGNETFSSSAGLQSLVLAMLSPDGSPVWSRGVEAKDGDIAARAVVVDDSGNVIVGAKFSGTVEFGGSMLASQGDDILLLKYASDGTPLWGKVFGSKDEPDNLNALATDGQGNLYLAGSFKGTVDFGGGELTADFRDAFLTKLSP